MMNNKLQKREVDVKDIEEIKNSFLMNANNFTNQSHAQVNQSCDGFLTKLNNSELINNSVNMKAQFG